MQLRKYQSEGVDRMIELVRKRRAAILADEPGLGKTAQVCEFINRMQPKTVLIVCPASLRINWGRELGMWLTAETKAACSVEVVSYESVVAMKLSLWSYALIVYDEAHYLKNPQAKRTKSCLSVPAKVRLYLTGTPVVNRPMDLFPVLKACGMKLDRVEYGKRYCDGYLRLVQSYPKKRYAWNFTGASNTRELAGLLREHLMIRRTKKEVLAELPKKIRQVIELDIPDGESMELKEAVNRWFAGLESAADNIKDLERIAFAELSKARLTTARNKLPYIIEALHDMLEEESKIVVFCHHREIIDALQNEFNFNAVHVYGGMSDEDKDYAVHCFQDGAVPIFLGQMQAAGTGLTLTAAHVVVFVEMDWVPGTLTQAEDRCHRIGQTVPVRVLHYVAANSVDAHIVRVVVEKQQVIEEIVG